MALAPVYVCVCVYVPSPCASHGVYDEIEMIELRTAVANQCVEFERKISTSIGERE